MRRSGEIGIHARFRAVCSQEHVGSSPISGIFSKSNVSVCLNHFTYNCFFSWKILPPVAETCLLLPHKDRERHRRDLISPHVALRSTVRKRVQAVRRYAVIRQALLVLHYETLSHLQRGTPLHEAAVVRLCEMEDLRCAAATHA